MELELVLGTPSEKQELFLTDTHDDVGFGGARGGGKSWAVDFKAVVVCCAYEGCKAMIVRKTYPELMANHIKPLKKLLWCGVKGKQIAKYNDKDKEITFPNGSQILFRYCDTDKDADRYQGTEVDFLFIDEATQFTVDQITKLKACVRGTNGYPKRTYYTCNPGGISHGYFKRLFIDKKYELGENPEGYSFIQSLVTDNKVLMEKDPNYIKKLQALPPKLKEAWLNGRWDVFEGAFFEEFRETPDPQMCHEYGISVEDAMKERRFTHCIEPFEIPKHWTIYLAYDWGYGKPFSAMWFAVDEEGCLYQILELYGCTGEANVGVKWNNTQQFSKIAEIQREHRWLKDKHILGVADPSIWDGSKGISANDTAEKHGIYFEKGVNDRISGWMQVRERLKFDEEGKPMLYIFNNCKNTIRTLPLMMFDERVPEDMDSKLEDHIADALRYMCMQRPIQPRMIEVKNKPMYDPLNQYKTYDRFRRY